MREVAWRKYLADVVKELVLEKKASDPNFRITEASIAIGGNTTFLSKIMGGKNEFSVNDLALIAEYFNVSEGSLIERAKKKPLRPLQFRSLTS